MNKTLPLKRITQNMETLAKKVSSGRLLCCAFIKENAEQIRGWAANIADDWVKSLFRKERAGERDNITASWKMASLLGRGKVNNVKFNRILICSSLFSVVYCSWEVGIRLPSLIRRALFNFNRLKEMGKLASRVAVHGSKTAEQQLPSDNTTPSVLFGNLFKEIFQGFLSKQNGSIKSDEHSKSHLKVKIVIYLINWFSCMTQQKSVLLLSEHLQNNK